MRVPIVFLSALLLIFELAECVPRRKTSSKKYRNLESDEDDEGNTTSWLSMLKDEQTNIDPCQDENGNGRKCSTDFENVAFKKQVSASSTCGKVATRHCQVTAVADSVGVSGGTTGEELVRTCQICDRSKAATSHPVSFLTDVNNPSNLTCWMSEPFNHNNPKNVSLRISFEKTFELTYISMQFCGVKPDSVAIYKSTDYGKSFQAFQYYSTNCRKTFGTPSRQKVTFEDEHEAMCSDPNGDKNSNNRIAFSTLDGRPSAYDFESSALLQDWVTATDIKIEFYRLVDPRQEEILPRETGLENNGIPNESDEWTNETMMINPAVSNQEIKQAYYYYSMADLAIGGRCKCNGHASRCMASSKEPGLRCDCRHNTAGRDCNVCKPFYFDRPWARATGKSANECRPCQCNGHSRTCHFSPAVYILSGKKSGGVCTECRHNTAGRHCQHCREGFYRDSTLPANHKRVCKRCDCHTIGSLGPTCNLKTGQCSCKDGVTGLTCNRCKPGYQHSRSPVAPCVRIHDSEETRVVPYTAADTDLSDASYSEEDYENDEEDYAEDCQDCREGIDTVSFQKYCKKNFAIRATILARKTFGDWIRFSIEVNEVFKSGSAKPRKGTMDSLWVPLADLRCRCPNIKLKESYIVLGSNQMHTGRMSMTGDRHGFFLTATKKNLKRLRRYQQRNGRCSQ